MPTQLNPVNRALPDITAHPTDPFGIVATQNPYTNPTVPPLPPVPAPAPATNKIVLYAAIGLGLYFLLK